MWGLCERAYEYARRRLHLEGFNISDNEFRSANSRPRQILQSVLARTLGMLPILSDPLSQVGVLADYSAWKRSRFENGGRPLFTHRERLWEAIVPRLADRGALSVLEFGVAWGYATRWWLQRFAEAGTEWHGFDTFTGLPTTWDRAGLTIYDAGSFSAEGRTPRIADPRVKWHVGDVSASITDLDWGSLRSRPLFVLLDFDLYEPTAVALAAVAPHLRAGDILYFDEAFDAWNERKAIEEFLRPTFDLACLGSTATALALEVRGPRTDR